MKSLKKLLSIFAAFMMVVGLTAVNVKAADETPTTPPTGTITLNDGRDGVTYTPYKIFDLAVGGQENNTAYAYTIDANSDWNEWLKNKGYLVNLPTNKNYIQVDQVNTPGTPNTPFGFTVTNDSDAIEFSTAIYKAISANPSELKLPDAAGTPFTVNTSDPDATKRGTSTTWTLPLGYYIIVPSTKNGTLVENVAGGAICNITTNKPNVTVAPKSAKPEVKKEAYEGDRPTDGSVSVGDSLRFVLRGTMPITTGYDTYAYELTDMMTNLTLDTTKPVVVKFGNTVVNLSNDELTTAKKQIKLSIDAADYQQYVGQEITVEYYATVDASAVTKNEDGSIAINPITNTVDLKYGPEGDQNGNGQTVTLTTTNLPVLKTDDATGTPNALAGAQFILTRVVDETTEYYRSENSWTTNKDQASTLTSDKNGNLVFTGIEDGSYTLTEVVAPTGYSKLAKDIQIKITKNKDTNAYSVEITNQKELGEIVKESQGTITVVNSTGHSLPSTGGMGTTMIYIAGAILMVGAAIIFVTNKRMKHE